MSDPEHHDQIAPVDGVYNITKSGHYEIVTRVADDEDAARPAPQPIAPLPPDEMYLVRSDLIPDWDGTVLHDPGPVDEPEPAPLPMPSQPPLTEEEQASVLEQVAAQRARLAEPPSNVDIQGAPHFARILDDGREVCGQDGESFPCAAWRKLQADQLAEQTGEPVTEEVPPVMAEAAAALGISVTEFKQRLNGG